MQCGLHYSRPAPSLHMCQPPRQQQQQPQQHTCRHHLTVITACSNPFQRGRPSMTSQVNRSPKRLQFPVTLRTSQYGNLTPRFYRRPSQPTPKHSRPQLHLQRPLLPAPHRSQQGNTTGTAILTSANAQIWGPKLFQYVRARRGQVAAACIIETHVVAAEVAIEKARLDKLGWQSSWAPGQPDDARFTHMEHQKRGGRNAGVQPLGVERPGGLRESRPLRQQSSAAKGHHAEVVP